MRIAIALIVIAFLASCNNDPSLNSTPTSTPSSIIGIWRDIDAPEDTIIFSEDGQYRRFRPDSAIAVYHDFSYSSGSGRLTIWYPDKIREGTVIWDNDAEITIEWDDLKPSNLRRLGEN